MTSQQPSLTLSVIMANAYDKAVKRNGGNMSAAARELGVTKQAVSIHYKRRGSVNDLVATSNQSQDEPLKSAQDQPPKDIYTIEEILDRFSTEDDGETLVLHGTEQEPLIKAILAYIKQEKIKAKMDELNHLHRLEADGTRRDYDTASDEIIDWRMESLQAELREELNNG